MNYSCESSNSPFAAGPVLRDSLFYFAPDKMRKEFESIWPREARNEGRGTGDGERSEVREARDEGKNFGQDQPDQRDNSTMETASSSSTIHGPRPTGYYRGQIFNRFTQADTVMLSSPFLATMGRE